MEIEFENEYLRELYENGKTKKPIFQPQVIKQYIKTVDKLRVASCTEELYQLHSLNYEKKQGDLKGIEAVKVNDQYRLTFRSRIESTEPTIIVICSLIDLTNHYKK